MFVKLCVQYLLIILLRGIENNMKDKLFILHKGAVCTIDPNNKLNSSTLGYSVVELIKKTKRNHWLVRDIYNNALPDIEVHINYLYPPTHPIIRYPSTMPVFNNYDLYTIDKLLENDPTNQNLLKIREKIYLSLKLREV